jgi:hypothetical protein
MKQYRVTMDVGTSQIVVKVWADYPSQAVEKAQQENKIDNCTLRSVKEL